MLQPTFSIQKQDGLSAQLALNADVANISERNATRFAATAKLPGTTSDDVIGICAGMGIK
jgi:hypothetical protein